MPVRKKKEDIKTRNEEFATDEYERITTGIKEVRDWLGISLTELSVKTQTYPSYLHRVETGQINTTVKKLIIILDALGLELKIEPRKDLDIDKLVRDLKGQNK